LPHESLIDNDDVPFFLFGVNVLEEPDMRND
jgi:hypothetical protein